MLNLRFEEALARSTGELVIRFQYLHMMDLSSLGEVLTSLSRRWLIEKGFGWLRQTGPLRQVKLRGLEKVDWLFVFSCAVHNLIRLPRLMAQPPQILREQCA
jgi:hypothetical protein